MKPSLVKQALVLWANIFAFSSLAITVISLPLIATEGFAFFAVHWVDFISLAWMSAAVVVAILSIIVYIRWRLQQ